MTKKEEIFKYIKEFPEVSVQTIVTDTGIKYYTVLDAVRKWRKEKKLYVSGWERHVGIGGIGAKYSVRKTAEEKDVPKPKYTTSRRRAAWNKYYRDHKTEIRLKRKVRRGGTITWADV